MDEAKLGDVFHACHNHAYRYFTTIGSTNSEAIDWVNDDAPEYSVVIADKQTAGRGRQDRKWITTAGASIALSIIIHPTKAEQKKLGLFSLLGGLAVRDVLETLYAVSAKVKWPNDVLIVGKKTAGILAESVWEEETLKGLVLGIGINLYKESIPPAESLLFPATCIQSHTNNQVDPYLLIENLIKTILALRILLLPEEFTTQYIRNMAFINEEISLTAPPNLTETGWVEGIDPNGNILLRSKDGTVKPFIIGDVSLRPK